MASRGFVHGTSAFARTWYRPSCNRACRRVLLFAFFASFTAIAHAQLAITEVMSAPNANSVTGFRGAEYWELTNFGTNDIDLDGYSFRDGVATRPLVRDPFTNLVIHAGESVIFFRVADSKDVVTNRAQFMAWWGGSNVPPTLQCRTWKSPGLSGWDGDAVVLLDRGRKVVDAVEFGRARPGRAFTYDPETGGFGALSAPGVHGAFTAALSPDVGSPGATIGSIPLRFETQPASQSTDAGLAVTFTALASGLPAPRYQWFAQGLPLTGAIGPELFLPNIQSTHAGSFHVVITNGISSITSAVAVLEVNTNPAAPSILHPPLDTTVFHFQTAVLKVSARGLPAPSYQWQSNGVDIPWAAGSQLTLPEVDIALSGTRYTVRVSNALGSSQASAVLTVIRRPDLRFTEVMALPTDEEGNRHFDWFELTNYDTNSIDLTGWRFSDQPSFARAFAITNSLVLSPGESAVFAERLDQRLFGEWWGHDHLPADFKFCSYSGFGLGYLGEQIFLWNAGAVDPNDSLASVAWAAATLGVTFECERWCDPGGSGCLDEAAFESVPGVRGAFRAGGGMDVGSPGYVANPLPRIVSMTRPGDGTIVVRCRVIAGRVYRLGRTANLPSGNWEEVTTRVAEDTIVTFIDPLPQPGVACFYRLEEAP